MQKAILYPFLISVYFFSLFGCSPPAVEKKTYDIVWPLPPQEPKVRFVDIIRGTGDFAKRPGILDTFFGEEERDL